MLKSSEKREERNEKKRVKSNNIVYVTKLAFFCAAEVLLKAIKV